MCNHIILVRYITIQHVISYSTRTIYRYVYRKTCKCTLQYIKLKLLDGLTFSAVENQVVDNSTFEEGVTPTPPFATISNGYLNQVVF